MGETRRCWRGGGGAGTPTGYQGPAFCVLRDGQVAPNR